MSKAEKLRKALPTTEAAAIDAAELGRLTGIKSVTPSLGSMIKTGEVVRIGERGSLRYWRKPDFATGSRRRAERALPIKRRKKTKKPRGATPNRKIKTLKQLARRVAAAANRPQPAQLAFTNLKAAGVHLARTVRAEVEGVEKSPTLAAALERHELAAALVEALA